MNALLEIRQRITALSVLLAVVIAGFTPGCTFDSSALDQKTACRTNDDCQIGVCEGGTCVEVAAADVRLDSLDDPTTDAAGTDASADDGSDECATPNECGGCDPLDASPGDPCPDACGTLRCAPDANSLVCLSRPENPCGGCAVLDERLGDDCGECGELVCDGPEALTCEDPGGNACGGCSELEHEIGARCGACDGGWMCDGTDTLTCAGGEPDACGTCGGDPTVAEGDVCECPGDHAALWACVGLDLVCDDGADSPSHPIDLGTTTDRTSEPVIASGTFHSGDDTDWFTVAVTDTDDLLDGLFPALDASRVPADRRICAYWTYDDGRDWDLLCDEGSVIGTIDGQEACCIPGDSRNRIVIMQDVIAFERLDDLLNPGRASGTLTIGVEPVRDDAEPSCRVYELTIRF